ncbi:MAG TPA: ABC transporter permease [Candidatus Limnocylindrales bacterium]|nr:ABC transporter permease [Candidatus Limnocylindrales bacterium]
MIAIARITLLEALRRRLLWALLGLTILSVLLTTWGIGRLVDVARTSRGGLDAIELALGVSQVLILVAFMFSFVLAMTGAFLGAPAIAGDLESGVALAVLARPIRRADLVVGRWLGLSLVLAAYALGAGILETVAVATISGYTPPDPIGAALHVAGEGIVLLTFALLLSTRLPAIAGGAIAVVAFGLVWMAGVLGGVGAFFGVPALATAADAANVVLPTDLLWRGAVFALEPPAIILAAGGVPARALVANPFYAAAPLSPAELAWAATWVAVVLGLAVLSLDRREI